MVNGALSLVLARAGNPRTAERNSPAWPQRYPRRQRPRPGRRSARPLAAAIAVSAVTLSVATFELAMADWPSGFVLLAVVPLMALVFFGCIVWSATLLLRVRTDGAKFALPFLI